MRIFIWVSLGFVALLAWSSFSEEEKPLPYPGGDSEISSEDPERAEAAIQKWSFQDEETGYPDFWDFEKVGRPVFIRIIKNDNREGILEVWLENPKSEEFEWFQSYQIAYYSGDLGPKRAEGDFQAPEGFYYVSPGRLNPRSSYHLSMDIGYPNAYDRGWGYTGGHLMIHGKAVSIGCFAMTDDSIEQIYTLVYAAFQSGQSIVRVHCFPFEMTEEQMRENEDSPHDPFWLELKGGWDWFEEKR
ncbi:MAG: L,D-transpeptidase family protein, partial [Verrucomicrobiota bacterium]